MAKLQGLLFGLATLSAGGAGDVLLHEDLAPTLESDRGAIDHAIW